LLTSLLDSAFMELPTDKWIDKLSGIVPVAPVLDIGAALTSPFVEERGGIQAFDRSDGLAARLLTNPIRFPGTKLPTRAAPALGADNLQLLREAGFSTEEIQALRDKRVITGAATDVGG
jgi:crotonobetainyl-CoA:carnitine CoA-transferase CaiB-like acyl-CoA transferase